jgi:hypothetical protein
MKPATCVGEISEEGQLLGLQYLAEIPPPRIAQLECPQGVKLDHESLITPSNEPLPGAVTD